jgi:hypothetical protein
MNSSTAPTGPLTACQTSSAHRNSSTAANFTPSAPSVESLYPRDPSITRANAAEEMEEKVNNSLRHANLVLEHCFSVRRYPAAAPANGMKPLFSPKLDEAESRQFATPAN